MIKTITIYYCDRCGKETEEVKYYQIKTTGAKNYDLCRKCFDRIIEIIEGMIELKLNEEKEKEVI